MSFIKGLFGYNNQKNIDNEETNNSSNNKTSESNASKCKAMQAPYEEIKESDLKIEHISLFDEKNCLIYSKLYTMFLDEVNKYNNECQKQNLTDIYRPYEANKWGGIDFHNKEITALIRSSGTEIIKQIGKKIISGNFNLTTISFPIKVMIPYSILQGIARSFFQLPYYMQLAQNKDHVEKMKFFITATISSYFCSSFFLKPMNPILGETYECIYSDGSKVYLEQSSHHPPVSHYEVYGPNKNYYYEGYSSFSTSAGLNSLNLNNKGRRSVTFKDGFKIDVNFFSVIIFLYIMLIY